jgi:hypothetical protein
MNSCPILASRLANPSSGLSKNFVVYYFLCWMVFLNTQSAEKKTLRRFSELMINKPEGHCTDCGMIDHQLQVS